MSQHEQAKAPQQHESENAENSYLAYQRAYGEGSEEQASLGPPPLSPYRSTNGGGSSSQLNQQPQAVSSQASEPRRNEQKAVEWDGELSNNSVNGTHSMVSEPKLTAQNEHTRARGNPKLALARQNRRKGSSTAVSTFRPHISDEHNPALADGTPLVRISDTVPCLYGPREFIVGFGVINNFHTPVMTPEDNHGAPLFKKELCGPRDSALLIVLMFAGMPAHDRLSLVYHWLEPFSSRIDDGKLLCYKSDGPKEELQEIEIEFRSFAVMLGDWQSSQVYFNPGKNNQEAIRRWSKILDMLKQRGVAVESVDHQLFASLTKDMDPEALLAKLDNVSNDFHSGRLRNPQNARRKRTPVSEAFDYTEPDHLLMDPDRLYAHRFSHAHPTGQLHDFRADNVGGIFSDARKVAANDPNKQNKIDLSFMGKYLMKISRWGRWTLIAICGFGIMAAVLVMLYFRYGAKNKKGFTAH